MVWYIDTIYIRVSHYNLYIYTSKSSKTTYYVKNSFRDQNGKSTSRIVERIGTHEELLQQHNNPKAYQIPGIGYLPCYSKTPVVDTLHNVFGFHTDYQINTNTMMKNIFHYTKS